MKFLLLKRFYWRALLYLTILLTLATSGIVMLIFNIPFEKAMFALVVILLPLVVIFNGAEKSISKRVVLKEATALVRKGDVIRECYGNDWKNSNKLLDFDFKFHSEDDYEIISYSYNIEKFNEEDIVIFNNYIKSESRRFYETLDSEKKFRRINESILDATDTKISEDYRLFSSKKIASSKVAKSEIGGFLVQGAF